MAENTNRRRPGLDLLRGVAIALVLLRHALLDAFPGGGIVGVTIFFTLSGFLITGILRHEVSIRGSVSLRIFYRNRAFRLLPALIVCLTIFVIVEVATDRLKDRDYLITTVGVGLLYLADVPRIPISTGMSHLWTLAVEEQFYLIWPILMAIAAARRCMVWILSITGIGSLVICAVSLLAVDHPAKIYSLPTSWFVALVIGAATQVYEEDLQFLVGYLWPSAALFLGATCFLPGMKESALTYLVGAPVIGAASGLLVLCLNRCDSIWRVAEPIRLLGLVSYAAYLWNYPIVNWIRGNSVSTPTLPQAALATLLTITVAGLSWWLIEKPALALKNRKGNTSDTTQLEASQPEAGMS